MKTLAHVDPVVLERELLARVDAIHPRDGVARTLVLAPNHRLVEHLQRKLACLRPAWLGLQVLDFRGLSRELLESIGGRALDVLPDLLLEAALRQLLRTRPDNLWSRFVKRRPGAARRLLDTFRELREAAIEPDDLVACAEDERTRDLAELYALHHAASEERTARGWTDEAGLARAARPHAGPFGKGLRAVFVHGAYEIIGVYLDLLRELDRTTDVHVLVPVCPGARATAYAERYATRFLLPEGGKLAPLAPTDEEGRAARLSALYDEDATPPPAQAGAIRFRHTQGAAAEVQLAVREALRAVSDGCPPTEIAITARTLEPYAAMLEEALDDVELPWTSPLGSPLRRHPVVREFLLLLRVRGEGFPREDTVELLQSRHIRWEALGCDEPPSALLADRWSRSAGVIDGLVAWTTGLEDWLARSRDRPWQSDDERERARARAREDITRARPIGQALKALEGLIPRTDARWGERAIAWASAFASVFGSPEDEAADALRTVLEAMRDLDRVLGDRHPVSFDVARTWFEEAVDATRLKQRRADNGGIRVLDAMQMRGLTFDQVHLLGMNGGLFPRLPREDPILADGVRRALRDRTNRPIGIKLDGSTEEHLVLAILLGSARARIDVSWQRAGESGRAKTASLALREIARAAHGRPDIRRVRRDARRVPSHPSQWLACLADTTGLLAPEEERLLAAMRTRAADAAESLGVRFPALRPGIEMLRATQSFEPRASAFDGRIEPARRDQTLSVSALATLGSCPLNFFFGSVLRVEPLEERATPFGLAAHELGSRVHELLEEIYRALGNEGLFAHAPARTLVGRGLQLLDERQDRLFGTLGQRLAERMPLLWRIEAGRWLEAVRRFVQDDLRRIGDSGSRLAVFEGPVLDTLDFGEGVLASVRGRLDRRLDGPDGCVVGDYKTSTYLSDRVNPASMLKGQELQVPLYRMLAGGDAVVELLGVHPDLDPADEEHAYRFAGFADDRQTQSFRHTLRVLLRLLDDGVFPLRDGRHCRWCDYRRACRRNHPPTVIREAHLADAADYRKLQTKSTRNPDGR